jgi:hypothetical protein
VLEAAGLLDDELSALSTVAARGLRSAVDESTASTFPARVEALDRRLGDLR